MITAMSLHPAEEICGTTASPEGVAGGMPSSGDKGVCSSGESLTNRTMVVTSEYVKFWIPDVDDALLPTLGRRFPTLAQGIQFYMDYARASGFDVRHSTLKRGRDGAINMRYLVCSREGVKGGGRHKANYGQDGDGGSTKQRRRRISNRVKCNARICLRKDHTGEFVISIFVEEHSHSLCSEPSRVFMRGNRKLNAAQQAFIADCIKANIGPSKGFRLYKEGAGSYANVGATNMEFHNFKRDLQQYIVGADGEMIIEKFTQKREVCGSFFFDYHLDEEQRLARLFWADPTCRSNYACYGDVLSFDATYDTNRYCLVFVPFTGVDNHKRCVTFAAGLLTREDSDSYAWLLEKFKLAMGQSPRCVVTDQDPAMKVAVERVFPECRHRFCMWHIMIKVGERIGPELAKDEVFRRRLNGIVWSDMISIAEFEVQWKTLMEEYGLTDHRWLCKLYAERSFWIPAFFTDMPMSGLLRTTSHSEAENNAFGQFTRPHSTVVEFYVQFESVLETQRHKQAKLNAQCEGYLPEFKTPLALERHVAQLYTLTIFYELQREIIAGCFYCRVEGVRKEQGYTQYDIKGEDNRVFCVSWGPEFLNAHCSCRLFHKLGLVCRHMFLVFKDAQLDTIPPQYVVRRWRKQPSVEASIVGVSEGGTSNSGPNGLWIAINACAGMVGNSESRMSRMLQVLKELRQEFLIDGTSSSHGKGHSVAIQALCGVQPPTTIRIKAPAKAKNKGSGKRMKSKRELAIEESRKGARKCHLCNRYDGHDTRNCPLKDVESA